MYRINVLITTYNQQNVIGRALDSVLIQKEYGLNKIIIADDCSIDNNWDVIQEYRKQYPDIIEAYRNKHNLGIYENLQNLLSFRGKADLFCTLAGDDALCDGWFHAIQVFILQNNLNLEDPISIYGDFKSITIDGKEQLHKQDLIGEGFNPFSLFIRRFISCGRSILVSGSVINQYGPLVLGRGLNLTEWVYGSQETRFVKIAYYIPYIGSVTYRGIGVSTQLDLGKSDYWTTQNIVKIQYFIDNFIDNDADLYYAKFAITRSQYYIKPSLSKFLKSIYYYHKGRLKGLDYGVKEYIKTFVPLLKYAIIK